MGNAVIRVEDVWWDIKVDMSESGCGGTNFIHWAQGRPFAMTVKNIGSP